MVFFRVQEIDGGYNEDSRFFAKYETAENYYFTECNTKGLCYCLVKISGDDEMMEEPLMSKEGGK